MVCFERETWYKLLLIKDYCYLKIKDNEILKNLCDIFSDNDIVEIFFLFFKTNFLKITHHGLGAQYNTNPWNGKGGCYWEKYEFCIEKNVTRVCCIIFFFFIVSVSKNLFYPLYHLKAVPCFANQIQIVYSLNFRT